MNSVLIILGSAFIFGYMCSWLAHGQLITRIKNTRFYMRKCGYTLATAWRRAGITL